MPHAFYFKSTSRKWDALKSFEENNIVLGGIPAKVVKHLADYSGGIPDSAIVLEFTHKNNSKFNKIL